MSIDNNTATEQPTENSDAVFHLDKRTARENGEWADLTVQAEDQSLNNSGRYNLVITMDTQVWRGEGWAVRMSSQNGWPAL